MNYYSDLYIKSPNTEFINIISDEGNYLQYDLLIN